MARVERLVVCRVPFVQPVRRVMRTIRTRYAVSRGIGRCPRLVGLWRIDFARHTANGPPRLRRRKAPGSSVRDSWWRQSGLL